MPEKKKQFRTHSPNGMMRGNGRTAVKKMQFRADELYKEGRRAEARELREKARRLMRRL